ncbi:MAG TPA: leucyl aminopeptidase, partial [Candidatus Poseidoniales archaeon]|nr:leucyl aminopeptidase [Candidatus Poseidoniales archaeon]
MQITVSSGNNINGTLILPLFQGTEKLDDSSGGIPAQLRSQINTVLSDNDFKGKAKSTLTLLGSEGGKAMLVGLGKKEDADANIYRKAGATVVKVRGKKHGTDLTVKLDSTTCALAAAFAEGLLLRDYSYDHYKTIDEDDKEDDINTRIICDEDIEDDLNEAIRIATGVTSGVHLSRDLGNAPPNDMYPMAYAKKAMDWAKQYDDVSVGVITYEEAIEHGMGGLIAVGKGSARKPCMVIFKLNEHLEGRCPVIVGKGITFDTGGISLKPGQNMDEMKYDMGGSATVFGMMEALASTGHSGKVIGITCMAENMPSSNAQRPGDVIKTLSGKTIEILNTDAEGRLVLADGLWKAGDYDPEYII